MPATESQASVPVWGAPAAAPAPTPRGRSRGRGSPAAVFGSFGSFTEQQNAGGAENSNPGAWPQARPAKPKVVRQSTFDPAPGGAGQFGWFAGQDQPQASVQAQTPPSVRGKRTPRGRPVRSETEFPQAEVETPRPNRHTQTDEQVPALRGKRTPRGRQLRPEPVEHPAAFTQEFDERPSSSSRRGQQRDRSSTDSNIRGTRGRGSTRGRSPRTPNFEDDDGGQNIYDSEQEEDMGSVRPKRLFEDKVWQRPAEASQSAARPQVGKKAPFADKVWVNPDLAKKNPPKAKTPDLSTWRRSVESAAPTARSLFDTATVAKVPAAGQVAQPPIRTLYLFGLDTEMNEERLRQHFAKFGQVDSVTHVRDWALVRFASRQV